MPDAPITRNTVKRLVKLHTRWMRTNSAMKIAENYGSPEWHRLTEEMTQIYIELEAMGYYGIMHVDRTLREVWNGEHGDVLLPTDRLSYMPPAGVVH